MYALISPDIKAFGTSGAYGIACSKISSLPAKIDFTFTATNGRAFNITVPSNELNVGPFAADPKTCQTLINAQSGYYIIGGSLLKHYYSVSHLIFGIDPLKLTMVSYLGVGPR